APAPAPAPQAVPQMAPAMDMSQQMPMMGQPMMQMPMMGQPMMQMPMMQMPMMGQPVNVQPAQFQAFAGADQAVYGQENIGLIMDVPLEVTVELGRTSKSIQEILDFAPGTILELNRIAGEPIDILVNGKYVAKGEVVVIEESFGVRITEIIK
ncbi:MAG: flagellar motor switch protein FliN, partial [Lachnospiraceae bacterium]|nr:flagellar motor switch protein FliN [Lachnospiraceae bacterium]